MNPFWMIWNEGGNAPRVKHRSEQEARLEAERLARCNSGQVFHVLVVVDSCRKSDVEWLRKYDSDVPL